MEKLEASVWNLFQTEDWMYFSAYCLQHCFFNSAYLNRGNSFLDNFIRQLRVALSPYHVSHLKSLGRENWPKKRNDPLLCRQPWVIRSCKSLSILGCKKVKILKRVAINTRLSVDTKGLRWKTIWVERTAQQRQAHGDSPQMPLSSLRGKQRKQRREWEKARFREWQSGVPQRTIL